MLLRYNNKKKNRSFNKIFIDGVSIMKISIITVCYNSASTIKDTLESVLKQSYTNYEYLIVDGKSKDNTLTIVKEYEKKFQGKLKYISEKDSGLYDAMNKGIKLATGDIIGIINSDDILAHKDVFKRVVEHIKDVDGVYSNLLMLDETLSVPYRLFKSKKVSKKWGWAMPHPTLYLKKEVYLKCGYFDLQYKITADYDFMLRILQAGFTFKYVDDYFVFMRSGGASTNGLKGYYNNFKQSYKSLKGNHIHFPFLTNCKRTIDNVLIQKLKSKNKKEISRAFNSEKKPKLIQINTVCNGSTGKIMGGIAKNARQDGYETLCIYGRRKGFQDLNCIKVGGFFSFWFHVLIATLFDKQGHGSYFKTKKMVRILRKENPSILHLHNIHGYYLNYKVLFTYLKKEYTGKIYWTFHDCWPFTGHCPYFTAVDCSRWKTECYHCPNKKRYPISLGLDSSKSNFYEKKKLFTGLKDLTIITPSDWLNRLVKESFLKEYPVVTIHNTIDQNIFKPIIDKELFTKYGIPKNKKVLLGVASIWEERKGLCDFLELASKVSENYVIVLIGLTEKQIKSLQNYQNIIGIKRTENQIELAKFYTMATYFLNLTYEDNYPTVNLEAMCCGAKVICYDTGGCREQVGKKEGFIVPVGDIKKVLEILEK